MERVTVDGTPIELIRAGTGKKLLFLHAVEGPSPTSPWLQDMAQHFEVYAPWHPGFGLAPRPTEHRSINDLALYYLDFIEQFGLNDAVLVGTSFGGWLAAEIAIRDATAFSHLVLIDPLGIKTGDRETRDIADVFALSQEELSNLAYYAPGNRRRDYAAMTDDQRLMIARSRESYTFYGWQPYMHNPTLRHWLHRIKIPSLVLWGAADGIVTPEYGRAYADALPEARFELVPEAGHYPLTEQPSATVAAIESFVAGSSEVVAAGAETLKTGTF
jgi:pimeloyl-ACP methyl ester carboxylesterase